MPNSNENYRTFIGYCGQSGQRVAEDLCSCLPRFGVYALAITPNISDARPYLESEEIILGIIGNFHAVVMLCTRRARRGPARTAYSLRFRDEAEKAIYELNLPTIAFISKYSSVLEILRRRTRIRFERGQHLANCERLAEMIKVKVDERRGVVIQPE